jgi:hypothetical protein
VDLFSDLPQHGDIFGVISYDVTHNQLGFRPTHIWMVGKIRDPTERTTIIIFTKTNPIIKHHSIIINSITLANSVRNSIVLGPPILEKHPYRSIQQNVEFQFSSIFHKPSHIEIPGGKIESHPQ